MPQNYIQRIFDAPEQSFFLFGPRGTGKSTMVINQHPNAYIIDLRIADIRNRLSFRPDDLLILVTAQPDGTTIIIDEIQKVPELLPLVHLLIEKKRRWYFILTGSSARKLKRQGVDLLGGRALKRVMHPFMAAELGDQFNLEVALKHGLLPLCWGSPKPLETLQGYISLYLEEEVKSEGLIRQYEPFTRFLQTMSLSHGQVLNISNISRECYVHRTTVHDWIGILDDLLISYQMQVFTKRAKRKVSVHPKFYLFDVGVYRAIRPRSKLDSDAEIDGPGLEGLVAQHLVAWRDLSQEKHEVTFWRTSDGFEVDFVILGPTGFWALEVKNSEKIRPDDLRGLRAFQEDYPEAQCILLYRGTERELRHNVLCLPVEDFLKQLRPNLPITPAV